mgnify:CR=1 FL=1
MTSNGKTIGYLNVAGTRASTCSSHRVVREIAAVPGRVEGDVVEIADLFVSQGDRLVRADGWPPHPERFQRAGIDLQRLLSAYDYDEVAS